MNTETVETGTFSNVQTGTFSNYFYSCKFSEASSISSIYVFVSLQEVQHFPKDI